MSSYKNFKNTVRKYKNSADLSRKSSGVLKSKKLTDEQIERIAKWVYLYRKNLHIFVEHYFGVKLFPYQKIWLFLMGRVDTFLCIAGRGTSKSYLVALLGICIAVLYPGSEIVIGAGTKKQAGLIISNKIKSIFQPNYPNISREIKEIKTNSHDWEVHFWNRSKMIVVPANDNAKGERSTFMIYEEFRLINKEVKDTVLSKFLYPRQTPFQSKYPELREEPREVYISSSGYKTEWIWEQTKSTVKSKYNNENASFIAFDYLVGLKHGLKTKKQIEREKRESDYITFMIENQNIMFGENTNAFFTYDSLVKNRRIKKAFYPRELNDKKSYSIKKTKGELRLISVDVARRAGAENDATAISCFRLFPTSKGYDRDVVYIESFNGVNTEKQVLRFKQIYYDFESDYFVLDIKHLGIAVYDLCSKITYDEEFNEEYPAWTIMNHKTISKSDYEDLKNATISTNAIPIIYPISASAELNHDIAQQMEDKLKRNMISFLVDELKAEDLLNKNRVEDINDYQKIRFLHPYAQTTALVNEMVALEYKILNNKIKLELPNRMLRKDRYSSVSYGNYFVSLLDLELLKESDNDFNWKDYIYFGKNSFK